MCRIQFLQDWIGKLSLYWIKIVNVINSDYKWETYFSMNKLFDRYASSGIFRFLWKIRIAAHKTAEEPLGAHATRNHSKNVCFYFSWIFVFIFFYKFKESPVNIQSSFVRWMLLIITLGTNIEKVTQKQQLHHDG